MAVFESVSQDQLARKKRPHYFHTHAFTVWCARPGVAGIFATAPQSTRDLQLSNALVRQIASAGALHDLVVDTRGFGVDSAAFEFLVRQAVPWFAFIRANVRRIALVLPDDWSTSWWVGSLPLWVPSKVRVETFSDVASATAWLGESQAFGRALSALEDKVRSESKVHFKLETLLRVDPLLNIEQVARKLGLSARSLQRALQPGGETFAAIRDRVRAELAESLLTGTDSKVGTVAATIGFRSRSHFMSWFRRVSGHSPGAFRQARARVR